MVKHVHPVMTLYLILIIIKFIAQIVLVVEIDLFRISLPLQTSAKLNRSRQKVKHPEKHKVIVC